MSRRTAAASRSWGSESEGVVKFPAHMARTPPVSFEERRSFRSPSSRRIGGCPHNPEGSSADLPALCSCKVLKTTGPPGLLYWSS